MTVHLSPLHVLTDSGLVIPASGLRVIVRDADGYQAPPRGNPRDIRTSSLAGASESRSFVTQGSRIDGPFAARTPTEIPQFPPARLTGGDVFKDRRPAVR